MKTFNKEMFERVDQQTREVTKDYLMSVGKTAYDNPDKYGADLIIDNLCYVECECKLVWGDNAFPWAEVNLPQRKEKFTRLDMPCMFMIWNKDFNRFVIFSSTTVADSKLVEVPNKEIPVGEKFFKITKFEERSG
jgi:hypothetical protein